MKKYMIPLFARVTALAILLVPAVQASDNLKLNPHLDYNSDSQDGPLITGDHMEDGFVPGKVTYAIIYGEACFNSKRQARRTVALYEKYKAEGKNEGKNNNDKDKIQFVVIDLDRHQSAAQQEIVKKFYTGSIPHVVVLNPDGKPAYNAAGEVDSGEISKILERAMAQ